MATANTTLVRTEQRLSVSIRIICRRTTSPLEWLNLADNFGLIFLIDLHHDQLSG
jgi:hypothetical protein